MLAFQPEAVSTLEAAFAKHGGVWKRVLAEFNSTQPQRSITSLKAKWAAVTQSRASNILQLKSETSLKVKGKCLQENWTGKRKHKELCFRPEVRGRSGGTSQLRNLPTDYELECIKQSRLFGVSFDKLSRFFGNFKFEFEQTSALKRKRAPTIDKRISKKFRDENHIAQPRHMQPNAVSAF